jgi:predicted RNA-binding Zn-ribbon protein involved in translation (DUF1610 family)
MTACASCGTRLRASSVRVYVPPSGEVALALCSRCSTRKPSDKLYSPEGIPNRSRTDLTERGRS